MNLTLQEINKPVRLFRLDAKDENQLVGGLLDYGYSIWQVAEMLNTPVTIISRIMTENGFTEAMLPTPKETK